MTKDEYVHYSDCRQASFTYRKARRFRDFINFSAYLDVKPNDDIIDILGFLAFEMVRSLCVTALEVRERHEAPLRQSQPQPQTSTAGGTSPVKRKSTMTVQDSPVKRARSDRISPDHDSTNTSSRRHVPVPLFAAPPSARQPLTSAHVLEAYAQIQRQQAANRVGGMRNFRGALTKGRMALV
jgi:transcription initiation protein SPT3